MPRGGRPRRCRPLTGPPGEADLSTPRIRVRIVAVAPPVPDEDLSQVLRRADHAMFEAKRTRRRQLGSDARR
jgi:PleD family two-component response regulator